MIKDFDTVRTQLRELAEVINAFKSEAVQLRIIDLVIGGAPLAGKLEILPPANPDEQTALKSRSRKRARKTTKLDSTDAIPKTTRAPSKGRPGGRATLETLVTDGFFKSPKAIGQIVEHCDTSLAMKYKQSDFSGPLMRLVREKRLTRKKNPDGQYEYVGN